MHRLLVSSTIVGLITISGLAFTLIAVVIARSPYTHGNLSPQGYTRTDIAYVGDEYAFEGLGLADPQLARTGDAVADGRALFFRYGCTSCHGLKGQGATVGVDLDEASPSEIRREVRDGPEGMPAYVSSDLSDEDLEKIIAFVISSGDAPADETNAETSTQPLERREGLALKGGSILEKIIAIMRATTVQAAEEASGAASSNEAEER